MFYKNKEDELPVLVTCHFCGEVDFESDSGFAFNCLSCKKINTRKQLEEDVNSELFIQLTFGDILSVNEFEYEKSKINSFEVDSVQPV